MFNPSPNDGFTATSVPASLGHIINEIECAPTKHCGFTDEELDFIPSTELRAGINYGITYRMGQDAKGTNE